MTFSGCCDRRLPYSAMFIATSTTIHNIKLKRVLSVKQIFFDKPLAFPKTSASVSRLSSYFEKISNSWCWWEERGSGLKCLLERNPGSGHTVKHLKTLGHNWKRTLLDTLGILEYLDIVNDRSESENEKVF